MNRVAGSCIVIWLTVVLSWISPDAVAQATIWSDSTTPANLADSDNNAVELGVKFRTDIDGYISGIRFYKGSSNTGTHTGSLWSSSGQLLSQATFSSETASGWQQVDFATPIAIVANTTYVASYHTEVGSYAFDAGYFGAAGVDTAPLHALRDGENGGNGVFTYNANPAFPVDTYNSSNYWVDVVFTTSIAPDTTPPTVTSNSPADGANDIGIGTVVTAVFSEAVNPATIDTSNFELRDPGNALVAATVSYDAGSQTATLTPNSPLGPATTYIATVKGGAGGVEDLAGNTLASDLAWSFTTVVAPDATPPTVTSNSPADGANDIGIGTVVTAVFSEAVNPATIDTSNFELRDPGNALVAATVSYDAGSQTATLTPNSPLGPATTYIATVKGGAGGVEDLAGNTLASDLAWSFTTVVAPDATPPTVTSNSPADGANDIGIGTVVTAVFSEAVNPATIDTSNFELRDPGNALVAATVSYDAGSQTATLTPNSPLGPATTYIATVKGGAGGVEDLAGNTLANDILWSFTTEAGPPAPCTEQACLIWPGSPTPANLADSDNNAVELGVKFRTDIDGYISGIRFYKGSSNTGTHTGSLWSSSGQLLSQATFSSETASGWQQVDFATPIAIVANTTYVASYHTEVGSYAFDAGYFGAAGVDTAPLHALRDGENGGNGVFTYNANPAFPVDTYNSSNYWVDVVFTTSIAPDTTPPTVTSNSPADGANDIGIGTVVTAVFSEAVNPATIDTSNFELRDPGNALVAATVSYDAGSQTATLTPNSPLGPATTYIATVKGGAGGVEDLAGNTLASDLAWSFTTVVAPDATPPTVTSNSPADGANDIGIGTVVTAVFSEAVNPATIDTSNFELRDPGNALVAATVSYDAGSQTATLTPNSPLGPATTYIATVKGGAGGVEDLAGNTLASDLAWSFTTVVAPDATPPTVTSNSPADGANDIGIGTVVTAVFSEAVNPATIDTSNFELRDPGNALVAATVSYDAGSQTATLTPNSPLGPATTYIATVKGGAGGVEDLAGNTLASDLAWSFTTVVAPDATPPTVTSNSPADGANDIGIGTVVTAVFSEAVNPATIDTSNFELRDPGNALVAATVSYDAGSQTATLTPNSPLGPATTYIATVKGGAGGVEDLAGNTLANDILWSFTTEAGPPAPCTEQACLIWPGSPTPANLADSDNNAVELGVKFRTDIDGYISGIRFYKGSSNTGTHTGSLWSSSGQLLSQATFSSETASGWQQVDFATPIAIVANTTYVASYHTEVGSYAFDAGYFGAAGVDTAPLHALRDGENGGNGVFTYNANPAFPVDTYNSSNYWVDVVFTTSIAPDTTPPTVTSNSPADGANDIGIGTVVTAVFSEAVNPATIDTSNFELRDPGNALVAATVSYDAGSQTATLTPNSPLGPATTYIATVKGGAGGVEDLAGNTLASDLAWSFTTVVAPDATPPTVTSNSPADGANDIGIGTVVTAVFSEAVNPATIDTSNFELRDPGNALVAATVSYDAGSQTATLTPNSPLGPATTYIATVKGGAGGVEDLAGNTLASDLAWSFTTVVAPDATPPTVTSNSPADGANDIGIGTVVTAVFSEAVNPATIDTSNFELRDPGNALVAATVSYDAGSQTATLTPNSPLGPATTYIATVKGGAGGVEDLAGNTLASDLAWSFTTVVAPDATPPTVTSNSPADGANDIGIGTVVTAVFSEAVNPATIDTSNFELRDPGNALVAATVSYDAGSQTATLTPNSPLGPATTYIATVKGGAGGVEDLAGNTLASDLAWSFTTVVAPDATPPTVTSNSPADGANDIGIGTVVTAVFSEAVNPATIDTSNFELRDPGNALVAATVSYDAGSQTATLTPNSPLGPATTYIATVKGGAGGVEDLAGNTLANDILWSFTTEAGPPAPCTEQACLIWPGSPTPANLADSDNNAVELGVKFRTDIDGYISGIRFYKGSSNTGTHTGSLWSSSGQLLSQATFSSETASGWQQVDFATPIAIVANTTYVASYHTEVGSYAFDAGYFGAAGVDTAPLHALRDGENGGNGVYVYTPGPAFPSKTYNANNYWIDIVFVTSTPPDTEPPTITSNSPADGANDIGIGTVVTAVFSEAVNPATIDTSNFELRDPGNALVAATVSYDAGSQTATLTPNSPLGPATTYIATVKGGAGGVEDLAGNTLASDLAWSFTTVVAPDATPPTVTSNSPADGANDIGIGTVVTAVFSEAVNPATIDTSNFELRDPGNALVAATVSYDAGSQTATLTPNSPLGPATTYIATVKGGAGGVEDLAGNTLASDLAWSFTTVVAPDATPPTVTSNSPADGANDIGIGTVVTAVFSEAVNPATIDTSNFELRDPGNALVAATVSYDAGSQTATLTPNSPLGPATTYIATVKGGAGGVEDLAGNTLASDVAWAFTTSTNDIVTENSLPGNPRSEWDITGSGDPTIEGFAMDISVNKGQTVVFKIDSSASDYQLDIYRLGYYSGDGARKVATVFPSVALPQNQPSCLYESSTGLTDCGNWNVSATWPVPENATSGIYLAKVIRNDTGGASHIVFVIRDDGNASELLFQTSDTTWQTYNDYGGNSLYVGQPAGRAYKVSYNRPMRWRSGSSYGGVSNLFNAEYSMVRWLEANGYDVSYSTGKDSDLRGDMIRNHKIFLSVGHDEYWSGQQRANVESALAAGVNLAFFSGNEVFWKTRWENSIDGQNTPYRTLVCYKETHANMPIDPMNPPIWTGTWRDPRFSPPADGGRPENALTGQLFTVNGIAFNDLTVAPRYGQMRLWRNTNLENMSELDPPATVGSSILGFEWDEDVDNGHRPRGLIHFSSTTTNVNGRILDYGSSYAPGVATHTLTLYRHGSGALVFGAGTVQWSWGLDGSHDNNAGAPDNGPDLRIQQATVNLFADMAVQPQSLKADLVAATVSNDSQAPMTTITSPTDTGIVELGTVVTVAGTALDSGGGVIGGVEVSVDGGGTWHPAAGGEHWSYQWVPNSLGMVTIGAAAVDDSANLDSSGDTVTVEVVPGTGSIRLWNDTVMPTYPSVDDPNPVELGVKFASEVSGHITGIRFYKGTLNTGTHLGHLWKGDGSLLATVTFENETESGWQYATFTSPVLIDANTTYIASYHTSVGYYSVDAGYFANSGADSPPLHALRDGVDGGNGVYVYGSSGFPLFPSTIFSSSNYWIDVDFDPLITGPNPVAQELRAGEDYEPVYKSILMHPAGGNDAEAWSPPEEGSGGYLNGG